MSSVAPQDATPAAVNGTHVLRPRLADRIALLQAQPSQIERAPATSAAADPAGEPAATGLGVTGPAPAMSLPRTELAASGPPVATNTPDMIASEQHAIEAASRLVSLIAEQRALLERLHQVAVTTPQTIEPRAEQNPTAAAGPLLAPLPDPAGLTAATAVPPTVYHGAPLAHAQPAPVPVADRPPMIIERAQAEHLAGGVKRDHNHELSRLPGLAFGFGLALAIGAILYLYRLAG